jgi:hypothetical protein
MLDKRGQKWWGPRHPDAELSTLLDQGTASLGTSFDQRLIDLSGLVQTRTAEFEALLDARGSGMADAVGARSGSLGTLGNQIVELTRCLDERSAALQELSRLGARAG